jgi:hypothetical protein
MNQGPSVSVAAFPLQMRRLHAGGDLSRPSHIHQCADRALMRSDFRQNACYTLPTSRAADMNVASC